MPTPPDSRHATRLIHLPRQHANPDTWNALVERWREFRLHSLKTAPEAFSSTYAREVAFEPSVWDERLRNPLAHTLVALSGDLINSDEGDIVIDGHRSGGIDSTVLFDGVDDGQDKLALLLSRRWAGVIVVLGPREETFVQATRSAWDTVGKSNMHAGEARGSSSSSATAGRTANGELYCHMNAVFTDPAYRGRGVARALIEEAYSHAEELSRSASGERLCCTILVDKHNVAAASLYAKCGFRSVGEETMVSPRKEKLDGSAIPEHEIQVVKMARCTSF